MRFTTSQTDVYADHLDWHYRQNRTEKDVSRKVTHRRWYYSLTVSNSCASELLAFKFYHSKSKLSNWWVLVNFLNKINTIIDTAIKNYKNKQKKVFSFESNILSNFSENSGSKGKLKA